MRFYLPVIIAAGITLASCEHQQELCFDHDSHLRRPVDVIFDWNKCPDATPSTMSLYLFPTDGSHYTRHEFAGREGGQIFIAPGVYTAIALNSDNESVRVNNSGNPENFSISLRDTRESQGASALSNDDVVCHAPDSLWISFMGNVSINGPPLVIPMRDACCLYSVEVKHLENSNLVRSIDATLSGMHRSVSPGNGSNSGTRLLFTMTVGDDSSASGCFLTFGHCGQSRSGDNQTEHNIVFYFTLGDGSVRYYEEDVTERVHGQPTERCHIVIDSLAVPNQTAGNADFTVEDWNIVEIPVSAN